MTAIVDCQDKVSVIGLGKLGLCMALCFESAGYVVHGVDVSQEKVDSINNRTLKSWEPMVEDMLRESRQLRCSLTVSDALNHSDLIMIVVDTPSAGGDNHYDVSKVVSVLSEINAHKVQNKHVVVCCTVSPGFCDSIGRGLLKDCSGTSLSYSPEFIAQGAIVSGLLHPDLVLIGQGSSQAGERIQHIYSRTCRNSPAIHRMSVSSAELAKLSINCYITMKISFANQIGALADLTPGAHKQDVLAAVGSDSRIGSKYLNPGYGFGGPCFPRDNLALAGHAAQLGFDASLARATHTANQEHAEFQAQHLLGQELEEYVFSDVCFKKSCPVPCIEKSQKLEVARRVAKSGRKVTIRDNPDVLALVRDSFGDIFAYEETSSRHK